MKTATPKAHKREHVLVDVKVEADLSNMILIYRSFCKDKESKAKELERAVKDFHDFLRDHRSQDMVVLDVQRIYKDLCSACDCEWELDQDEETGRIFCAGCGTEIEQ